MRVSVLVWDANTLACEKSLTVDFIFLCSAVYIVNFL